MTTAPLLPMQGRAAANGGEQLSYLQKILQPGETVRATGRLHWVIFLQAALLMLVAIVIAVAARFALDPSGARIGYIAAAVLFVLGLVGFLGRLIVRATTEYAVTDHRLIAKRGLISTHTVEMNLDKVESVDVDQTLLGRVLGYGAVTVHGTGSRWDPIPQIANPIAFRNAITSH